MTPDQKLAFDIGLSLLSIRKQLRPGIQLDIHLQNDDCMVRLVDGYGLTVLEESSNTESVMLELRQMLDQALVKLPPR